MKTKLLLTLSLFFFAFALNAQWAEKNNGLFGGQVNALFADGNSLYAGTWGGGVFLSTNNGSSWADVNFGLTNPFVHSLVVSGSNLYAGTTGGVFLSNNNGSSWMQVNIGLTNLDIYSLVVSGGNLYAGSYGGGVFLSTNNGASWMSVKTGLTNENVYSLAVNASNLYAATDGGVFISSNNGTSWMAVNTGLTDTSVRTLALNGSNLYAGTYGGDVFLSNNNGNSWKELTAGLNFSSIGSLAVSGSNLFAGTYGDGVFLSTNNGVSWTAVNTGLTNTIAYSLVVTGSSLFVGTSGSGIFRSTNNGTSWLSVNTGLTSTFVLSVVVSDNNLYSGIFESGVFLSTNNSDSWMAVKTGLTNTNVRCLAVNGNNLYAGTDGGGVFLSTNNGTSWTALNTGLTNTRVNCLAVYGNNLYAGTSGGGIFRSSNNSSWIAVNTGLTSGDVRSLIKSGSNLYAGTSSEGVFLSSNYGASWTAVNAGLPNNAAIYSLAVSGANLYVGTYGGGVFFSSNNGVSWTATNARLPTTVNSLAASGSNLYAGTSGEGVFLSTNGGSNWMAVNTGLNNNYIYSLAVSSSNNLYAGTAGSGLWERPLVDFGVPTITSFAPSSSTIGTSVIITGVNFSPTLADNIVTFNGVAATVTASTSTSITVTVPTTNTGRIQVTLNDITAVSNTDFIVQSPPAISSFFPASGSIGTSVTITGTNFDPTPANNNVTFNGVTAIVTASTSTSIIATVPTTNSGRIQVITNGMTTVSSADFTVQSPPTISAFLPISGPVGTSVTISGTNFSANPANNVVIFGATAATVTAATSNQLTVTAPTGATYAPITVLNAATGLLAYSSKNFTPTFTPSNTSITVDDFSAKLAFTTGSNPNSVAVGDLDGDGKADLAVANVSSGTVSVFRNTSNIGSITSSSFAAKVDFTTGSLPYSVAIGDLDSDGKADLAVANFSSSTVSVFRNTGSSGSITSSSFAAKVDFNTGSAPSSVSINDLDSDGKADLAVANFSSNTVSIFRNTGSRGSITSSSFAAKVDFNTGTYPYSVAIGDLDGDGKADLAVANSDSNTVSVFRNIGSSGSITSSSFAAKVDFNTGRYPYSVAIGDLDGDGKADLAVANFSSSTVSVFLNTGTSSSITSSSFATKVDLTTGVNPYSVAIGDLDGNGKAELAVANFYDNSVSVLRNTGSSGITASSFAAKVDFIIGGGPTSLAIGDLDGDGKADLAVAETYSNTVSVIRNNPVFSSPPSVTSFSPISGAAGTSVLIRGTGFSTTPANNLVTFNGIAASVTASTTTSITATVPAGATSGPISVTIAGNTSTSANFFGVQVKACGIPFLDPGGNGDYTNNQTYAQTFSPVNPTEKVTVSFSSLDLEQENDFLYVYNGPSTASSLLMELTGTTLPSNITSSAPGGELTFLFTSDQSVTRSGWTANISCGVPPTVTSFTPVSGQVGTSVTITGTNFSTISSNNVVKFNGALATVIASTSTSITAAVPAGATSGTISVAVAGHAVISATNFTVVFPQPTITSFSPAMGAVGTSVTIAGTNFDTLTGNTIVTVNGQIGAITSITSTGITVTVPSNATTGKIGVTVAGQAATSSTDFTVLTFPGEWLEKNNGIYTSNWVNALVVNGNDIYAGTSTGVFRSTNNGTTWTAVNLGLSSTDIRALAVSGINLFAGTGGGGVFLSTNNGANWTAVNSGLPSNPLILSLVVSEGNLYAGTYNGGVFRSTNSGTSWTSINTGLTNTNVASLAVSGSNLYAGTYNRGVFRSTDNGNSWTAVNAGLPSNPTVYSLAAGGGNLYAGTFNSGVFRSTDNGNSWTAANSGLTTSTGIRSLTFSGSNLYAGTGANGVFRSTNNGISWTEVNTGLPSNSYISSLSVSGGNLYAGTNGGVFRSTNNGISWTASNSGLNRNTVRSFAASGDKLYAGTYNSGGVFRSTDNGTNWTAVNMGLTNTSVQSLAVSGSNLFAGTDGSGVFLSTNNGTNWTAVNTGLPSVIRALAVSGNNLFAGTNYNGVYRSANNGASWTEVNSGLPENTAARAFAVIGNNLFMGTFKGGIFLSSNNGESWTPINSGLTNLNVYSFAVIGNSIFAATNGGGVFVSTNNGASWTSVGSGLLNTWVYALAASGNNLFAGTTENGVFLSTNNGNSWTAVNNGLPTNRIASLHVSGSELFAGSWNGGVWSRPISELVLKQFQSITFTTLPTKTFGDANFALSATASSGLPVTYTSSNTSVATIAGNTVTIVGAGTSTITASQAGNDFFAAAANVTQTLTVNKASQAITFTPLSDKTLGDAPFALTGIASSNLPVSYAPSSDKITISSSGQVTLVKAGRISIVASQVGNDNFDAATSVTQNFCIKPAKPTVTSVNSTGTVILTSSATAGNQWYLAGNAISGSINQSFSATASGVYKVQVTADDCVSEFSADQPAIVTGDIEQDASGISVSPNPVESILHVYGIVGELKSTQVFDMTGRATSSLTLEKNNNVYQTQVDYLSPGVYLLRMLLADNVAQVKFIKK